MREASSQIELVSRARGGDVEAFEALYRAHVGRIHAVCLRMTGNRATAEDLVQEAFVRAWRKLSSLRTESTFSSWLLRLTVNLVVSHLRSRLPRELEDAFDERAEPGGRFPNPAARVDLEEALRSLPAGARLVVVLHDLEGYRHEEIARLMGTAVGTSKAQLHRARRLLRGRLVV
jgi:RNA polymerase sigma-70 factor (ECF subfamily)